MQVSVCTYHWKYKLVSLRVFPGDKQNTGKDSFFPDIFRSLFLLDLSSV